MAEKFHTQRPLGSVSIIEPEAPGVLLRFIPEVGPSCLLSIIVLLFGVGGGPLKFVHAQFLFSSDPLHTEGVRYDLTLTLFLLKNSVAFGV